MCESDSCILDTSTYRCSWPCPCDAFILITLLAAQDIKPLSAVVHELLPDLLCIADANLAGTGQIFAGEGLQRNNLFLSSKSVYERLEKPRPYPIGRTTQPPPSRLIAISRAIDHEKFETFQYPWLMFADSVYVGVEIHSRLVKQPEHVEGGVTSGMAFSLCFDIFLDMLAHELLNDTDVFICMLILACHQFRIRLARSQTVADVCKLFLVEDKDAKRFVYSNSVAR